MVKPLLVCKDPDSALESLASILRYSPDTLLRSLKQLEVAVQDVNFDTELKIANRFLSARSFEDFEVVGFHGTRLTESHTIRTDGLLPTSAVKSKLRDYLRNLAVGLIKTGVSPVGHSYASKNSGNHIDEGPFGLLFYEAAANPKGSNGQYIDCPELVADLAGEMLGENCIRLIEKFRQQSDPYIIHYRFSPPDKTNTLSRALLYTYLTQVDGQDSCDVANSNSYCFDGNGVAVRPEMIIEIERVVSAHAR